MACQHLLRGPRRYLRKDRPPAGQSHIGSPRQEGVFEELTIGLELERVGHDPRGHGDLGYASHEQTIATAVTAIAAVASQPIICIGRGSVNSAMIERRIVRSIIVTITGTAT